MVDNSKKYFMKPINQWSDKPIRSKVAQECDKINPIRHF